MGRPKGSKNKDHADCHPTREHYGKGLCAACYQAMRRKEFPEQYQRTIAKYKAKGGYREAALKAKYGITLRDFNKLLAQQKGKCAICHKTEPKRNLAVDHDHVTGKIRGLLCTSCNTTLGKLEKLDWITAASKYLVESK